MRDHACDHPERSFLPIFWQMSFPTCSAATSARRAITSTVKTIHSSYLRATTDTLFDGLIDVANRPHNLRLLDHIAVTHYMLTEKQADAPPSSRFSPASSDWSYRRHDNGERITVLEVQIDQLLRALVCLAIARLSYPTAESTPPDSSPRRQTAGCRRRRHLSQRSPPIPLVSSRGCINDSKKYTRRSSATSSYASSPSETPTACRETTRLAISATASFDGTLDETSPPPPLFELQETGELAGLRHQLVTRLQLTQLRPHLL